MDTEEKSQKSIEDSKSAIFQAENIMEQMAAMKQKLNIKEGAGRRFLQKTNPKEAALQQAEQLIEKEYSGSPSLKNRSVKKRKNLMNALARYGRA